MTLRPGRQKRRALRTAIPIFFSKVFCDIAKQNDAVVGITAAMADGTGLARFAKDVSGPIL